MATNLTRDQVNAKLDTRSENAVFEEVWRQLELMGFHTPKVWRSLPRPPRDGRDGIWMHTQQRRRSGVTLGLPDMFVSLAGTGVWVGIELKARKYVGSGKRLAAPDFSGRPEQKWLFENGHTVLVRSAEDVRAFVERMRNGHMGAD